MKYSIYLLFVLLLQSCSDFNERNNSAIPEPRETIDLGTLVTEDITSRLIGDRWRNDLGFTQSNSFEIVDWESGNISGQNSYYTLFNHGGPHIDAPNHFGLEGGLDSYPVESFTGPVRAFDVSNLEKGRSADVDIFEDQAIQPGDVVLIYTNYIPPPEGELPESITLTRAAAVYLAGIPIRAFGTDAYSAGSRDSRPVEANSEFARSAPIHEAFLANGIPIYEQLHNLELLLTRENMLFTGVPIQIENGDGMIVRPVVFVY